MSGHRAIRAALAAFALAACVLAALAPAAPASADPNALWRIVDGQCVPNEQQRGDPAPCALVDLAGGIARGHAVLKDIRGRSQYLLIPTARISGIEDPILLAPDAPNYFAAAWAARRFVEAALGRAMPRDALSVAINSAGGRTQNELHIHVDCVAPAVQAALSRHADAIGPRWAPFPEPLAGQAYQAMRLAGATLEQDPFRLLAEGIPGARDAMGLWTLVAVGAVAADGAPGFVLLARAGDTASGEWLQDHGCALARDGAEDSTRR